MNKKELDSILKNHKLWLSDNSKGERANLLYADLRYADLLYADLRYADLRYADLRYANLQHADLRNTNLLHADLRYANLQRANLLHANLLYADLRNTKGLGQFIVAPKEGSFMAYKMANTKNTKCILILEVKKNYKRVNCIGSRKCRGDKVFIVGVETLKGKKFNNPGKIYSSFDSEFLYKVGKVVKAERYNPSDRIECSDGIHFFITKQEAIEY